MDRAENQIATALKPMESHFNAASIYEAGTLPSRTDNTWPRSGASNAQEHLPGLQLTDGNRVLVADSGDNKPASRTFQLGATATDFTQYADDKGNVPFGPALKGGISDGTKPHNNVYYNATIGFETIDARGNKDDQIINVNIGDAMKVNGKAMHQGENRGTFPIANEPGSPYTRYHWIDASVVVQGTHRSLLVHGLSPSEQKPAADAKWEPVNTWYRLKPQATPVHVTMKDYIDILSQTNRPYSSEAMRSNCIQMLGIKESAK